MPPLERDARERIGEHLAAVHALASHGLRATRRQEDTPAAQSYPEAKDAVLELVQLLGQQLVDLEQRLATLRLTPTSEAAVAGPPAPGPARAARAVAEDCDFLSRLVLAYQKLHAASLRAGDRETADLADHGCHDTSLLLMELNRLLPRLALNDRAGPESYPPGVQPSNLTGAPDE